MAAFTAPKLNQLRTKLTVLYAGLFGLILLLISLAVYSAVTGNAERTVRGELSANAAVFDRIWALRSSQLHDEADVLAHDFGFRAAVATGDNATIRSALENLRTRLGIDAAFVVGLNGQVVAAGAPDNYLSADLIQAVQNGDQTSGVFTIGKTAYHAASAPIMAPTQVGAVLFADRIDRADMASLEKLAAIPLHASVLSRQAGGRWTLAESSLQADPVAIDVLAAQTLAAPKAKPGMLRTNQGVSATEIKPLATLAGGEQAALLITYPMNQALAPVSALLTVMLAIGAVGLILLVAGSWALASTLTRPLSALEAAVERLRHGEEAQVDIASDDEIARLGSSFNAMARDIRDREERLERARDLAEAANRTKSAFLANMSHEVRTPLNGVLGVAGVLAGTDLDAKQRQMVTIIESSAGTLQRVLSDVLDLARMEAGRIDILAEPFALGAVVRTLAEGAEIQASAKGLEFELLWNGEPDPWVIGDRVRLEQVLGNLLGNALKFTEKGRIELVFGRSGEAWRIEVRDTGIGFDPDRTEQLFQPFHQADDTITRRFGGTGLGLSIARDLARGMGGELSAAGLLGAGAVFTLAVPLPACAPGEPVAKIAAPSFAPRVEAPPAPTAAELVDEAEPGALHVLVADDHATNREVVRLILESAGVALVAVEDGAQAVEAFKGQPFDAVLMDIQMPVMDGLTAVRLIREYEHAAGARRTPIIVLSANVMPEHLAGSAAAGADSHIGKPVLAPVLLQALDEALTEAEAEAESGAQAAS
jgi:signal transduction histidine kinase/AmiR/NasT family two-component response regulator